MRVLWVGRIVPAASTSGDRVYSRGLATALAEAGAEVTVVGLADPEATGDDRAALPAAVRWIAAPGGPTSTAVALASLQPLVVRRFGTAALRRCVAALLRDTRPDAVVLDNYAAAWALPLVRRAPGRPAVVHVAHNHEAALARTIAADSRAGPPRRLALRLNAWKIGRAECALLRASRLVVTLTDEDARALRAQAPGADFLTLPPGHAGAAHPLSREITEATPRRVVLLGSYRWEAKQMNLRALLAAADGPFAAAGVGLDVVGDLPEALRRELEANSRSAVFHGFVRDADPLLAGARAGLVPEVTGGGFKLKTLDYVFAGVPVAALDNALAGLPRPVRAAMISAPDLPALVKAVLAAVDDLPALNGRLRAAYAAAAPRFSWAAGGQALLRALESAIRPEVNNGQSSRDPPKAR